MIPTRVFAIAWAAFLTVGHLAEAAQRGAIQQRPNFVCYYEAPSPGVSATVHAVFYRHTPTSAEAEKALHSCLDASIAHVPGQDIVATAWSNTSGRDGDEHIVPLGDGSRHLSYSARTRSIATRNEREGIKPQVRQAPSANFFVEYEERNALTRPDDRFATVKVVFKTAPDRSKAYEILLVQLRKAVSGQTKKWPTSAYAYVGDRSNPAGWKQVIDSDGAYIFIDYSPATGQIARRGMALGSISP